MHCGCKFSTLASRFFARMCDAEGNVVPMDASTKEEILEELNTMASQGRPYVLPNNGAHAVTLRHQACAHCAWRTLIYRRALKRRNGKRMSPTASSSVSLLLALRWVVRPIFFSCGHLPFSRMSRIPLDPRCPMRLANAWMRAFKCAW